MVFIFSYIDSTLKFIFRGSHVSVLTKNDKMATEYCDKLSILRYSGNKILALAHRWNYYSRGKRLICRYAVKWKRNKNITAMENKKSGIGLDYEPYISVEMATKEITEPEKAEVRYYSTKWFMKKISCALQLYIWENRKLS